MARLGILDNFTATHGTRCLREDMFGVEVIFSGKIRNGFVDGLDYDSPVSALRGVLSSMNGAYLDDIIGRATDEDIALYILFSLRKWLPHSVRVYEGNSKYVEVSPSDLDFNEYPSYLALSKAKSLLMRERPSDAIEELNQIISMNHDFADAYNLRGRCHKYMDRYDLALLDYMRALIINPDFGEAYRNLGNAYYYLDDNDQTIPVFTKAIELMPNSALAYNNRGFAYQKLEEFELAAQDHTKAIEIDPNYAEAYGDRGDVFMALGMKDLAERDYQKARELADSGNDTYAGIVMY